ncbi:MAG: ABC transporter ATP-binding protein [Rhodospirillaceae bacterium]|nr:ABC transporter ATP-binding protein [Rhodospirillaceae bacterium]
MSEPAAAPLDVRGVSTSYGKTQVLNGVGFTLAAGEAFGLIGLNGAGKTTLLRSILALRRAEGVITFFGRPNHEAAARRRIVYLPEKFMPSPQLYGWEYLSIHLDYFDQKVDRPRAAKLAAGLDLDPAALDRTVRTYSKGMGQKLGLIATLLVDAPLMLLDEPMSGLDPRARVLLKDRLMEAKAAGRTIFFSSHILADIEEICDRIGVLHGGRIIYLGDPQRFIAETGESALERAFLAALDRHDRAGHDRARDRAAAGS